MNESDVMKDENTTSPLTRQEYLARIMQDSIQLANLKLDPDKHEVFKAFIDTAINGDIINTYLVTDANVRTGKGVAIYVLTNVRLIQFSILLDPKPLIDSASFLLSSMMGIERKLLEDGRIELLVNFGDKSPVTGIRYSTEKKEITAFFQLLEKTWVERNR